MNKQLQGLGILLGFFVIIFLLTLTSQYGAQYLYPSTFGENTAFDGLIFDEPVKVNNLTVKRSNEAHGSNYLYKYDIHFSYEGDPSDVRILGTPVRNIYFPEGVTPSRSNATLKGDYDQINTAVKENLTVKDIVAKNENFAFLPKSEMRLPLTEDVGEYDFTIYAAPRKLHYGIGEPLADVAVFVTNSRVSGFTDSVGVDNPTIQPFTSTHNQSGMYSNVLELVNEPLLARVQLMDKVSIALFVLAVVMAVAGIFLGKNFRILILVGMVLGAYTMPFALGMGMSHLASLIIIPLLALLAHVLYKLMGREQLRLEGKDFRQGLGIALLSLIISVLIFVVPAGLMASPL
ncbi:MAG: hypothetical protein Q4E76_04255 [Tissierellia bacterium]|nr:hypothetical protein [Tissierellia bacterium]